MIRIVVNEISYRRLRKLKEELDYVSAGSFFRTISLSGEQKAVEAYMEKVSPQGGHISDTKLWLAERGIRPLLPQFSKGWRVKRITEGNKLVWSFSHILESSSRHGARAKFLSIEFGSRKTIWHAPRDVSFKDYGQWFHVEEGEEFVHVANKAANVIKKTSEFVRRTMIPEITTKIQETIEDRLDRV